MHFNGFLFCRTGKRFFCTIEQHLKHIHEVGQLGSMNHFSHISAAKRKAFFSPGSHQHACCVINKHSIHRPSSPSRPRLCLQNGSMLCKSLNRRGALVSATRNLRLQEKTNRCYLNRITHHPKIRVCVTPCLQIRFPLSPSKNQSVLESYYLPRQQRLQDGCSFYHITFETTAK